MSAYPDRSKTALMVIDVQNGVVDYAKDRNAIVGRIAELVERARSAGTEVIWVQHSEDDMPLESEYWQIVPELKPRKGEPDRKIPISASSRAPFLISSSPSVATRSLQRVIWKRLANLRYSLKSC